MCRRGHPGRMGRSRTRRTASQAGDPRDTGDTGGTGDTRATSETSGTAAVGERRSRRTQAERRAHTHGALLDATIACLVERGYSRTSTNDIIRVAGVSRGALLHHFASKAELLGAAVELLFERCELGFREAFAALPVEERTLER